MTQSTRSFSPQSFQPLAEGVAVLDHARHFNAVKKHVGGTEEVGKLLFLDAPDAVGDRLLVLGARFLGNLFFKVIDGGGKEPACAASGVKHGLALFQFGINHLHHELSDGPRCVELAGVSGTAQVVENLLVDTAKLAAGLHVVKIDGLVELFDDAQHKRAGLHIVIGIRKDFADNLGLGVILDGKVLEPRENLYR